MAAFKRIGITAIPYVVVYVLGLALISAGVINAYIFDVLVTIGVNIILAASLNLITGFTGQFSLGHAGFMAIGAYTAGITAMNMPTPVGALLGILLGAVFASAVGALVGIPTLRLRGDYLAIATLGMAEIIRIILLNLGFTNGAAGLSIGNDYIDWNWLFGFTAITLIVLWNYIRSSQGRRAVAIREDEIAAEAIGVNTTMSKVQVFTIGAFFAGIGGGLYAMHFYVIKPDQFDFMKSIDILVIVVLGGLGSLSGTVVAAVLLALVSTFLQDFSSVRMILYSLILVVIMIFRPGGLMGSREVSEVIFSRIFKRSRTKTEAPAKEKVAP